MKLFRKIDTTTGNFIEDCLFDSLPILTETVLVDATDEEGTITQAEEIRPLLNAEGNQLLDPQYVEETPPQGLYLPRWTGTEWIEGGQAPEPVTAEPTVEDRLAMAEMAILDLMME
ncbi:hypothetical protein C8U37_107161 [Trichococcus patagoniensis]|uniref:Uncharacterized protein n=1 Tax=Trichococcus patagoniensis TaxID=382641 RepID=A0A2T5ILU2_9LACT|nr:hypothetical protein [Trichococcus patagoniensis]PTQ84793.1 hypothetical protein C8U37_107161 [Trichococcus patagoniensis]